jgi:hypothetical protein
MLELFQVAPVIHPVFAIAATMKAPLAWFAPLLVGKLL